MAATDCYCHCPCDGSCCCSAHGTAFPDDANDDGCCGVDVAVRAAADAVGVAHARDANDDGDEDVRYAVVAAAVAVGLRNDGAAAVAAAAAHDGAAAADACGLAGSLAVVSTPGRACCFAGGIWRRRSSYHRRAKLLPGYWLCESLDSHGTHPCS